MPGKSRLWGTWLFEAVSFPEDAVVVALDGCIMLGIFQTFECPTAVFPAEFDAAETTAEFFGDDGGGSAPENGVEDEVARA